MQEVILIAFSLSLTINILKLKLNIFYSHNFAKQKDTIKYYFMAIVETFH